MGKPSLRRIAKELDISAAYLSYMGTASALGGAICTSVTWALLTLSLTVGRKALTGQDLRLHLRMTHLAVGWLVPGAGIEPTHPLR